MPARLLLLFAAVGLALVALGPSLEMNVWRARQIKALLGAGSSRPAGSLDLGRANRRDLVLEALRRVDDPDGGASSRQLLEQAIETEGGGEHVVAILFEQQAERWNDRG